MWVYRLAVIPICECPRISFVSVSVLNTMGFVATGGINAVGIVAIGGINSRSALFFYGSLTGVLGLPIVFLI